MSGIGSSSSAIILISRSISSFMILFFVILHYHVVTVLLIIDTIESTYSFTPRLALFMKRVSNHRDINHHHVIRSSPSDESVLNNRIMFEELKHLLHNSTTTVSTYFYNDKSHEQQELMLKIVQCGRVFFKGKEYSSSSNTPREHLELKSPLVHVPGCVANVHVSTTLIPIVESYNKSANQYYVEIDGSADSLISQGLLALIASSLDNATAISIFPNASYTKRSRPTAQNVLDIDPTTVADALGLRSTLSRGRNDGLASIVTTVQQQIRSILLGNNYNTVDGTIDSATSSSNIYDASKTNQNINKKKTRVAMLLSGGVDSSVALSLLANDPQFEVHAFYLKIWLEDELSHLGVCPWEEDWEMCQKVVAHLSSNCSSKITLKAVSFQNQYHQHIINYTLNEAKQGRTPNPDIMCNARVKFGCFLSEIMNQGDRNSFDYIASGHYARVLHSSTGGSTKLFRAPDAIKDQSYFLSTLSQEQLQRVLFPIGHMTKEQVRALAVQFDLPNKDRPDSQGLCFLGKVKFDNFLHAYLGEQPGNVVDASTLEVIGRHKGLWFHTVGQRKGIGKYLLPKVTNRGPWFIVAKDPKNNIIFASNEFHDDDSSKAPIASSRTIFFVEDIRWVAGLFPQDQLALLKNGKLEGRFDMKIRHGPTIARGTLLMDALVDTNAMITTYSNKGRIQLEQKDGGLAPGQFVVFYKLGCDECLGSGVISEDHWSQFLLSKISMTEDLCAAGSLAASVAQQ